MLKTTIVMDEVIISSNYTPEDICRIEKFAPEALVIKDNDGNEVFSYEYGGTCIVPVSKFGITFSTVNNDGKACAKVKLPSNLETTEDKKKWIGEELGAGLRAASVIEGRFARVLNEINSSIEDIISEITVIA